jgi:hypothetical protein
MSGKIPSGEMKTGDSPTFFKEAVMARKALIYPVILIALAFVGCQKKGGDETPALAEGVDLALTHSIQFFQNGDIAGGAVLLLDSIFRTRPVESWPEGFVHALEDAKINFRLGNLEKAAGFVSLGLSHLRGSEARPEAMPQKGFPETENMPGEGRVAPLSEIVRQKILESKEEFKKGNAEAGAVLILEALQLLGPRS